MVPRNCQVKGRTRIYAKREDLTAHSFLLFVPPFSFPLSSILIQLRSLGEHFDEFTTFKNASRSNILVIYVQCKYLFFIDLSREKNFSSISERKLQPDNSFPSPLNAALGKLSRLRVNFNTYAHLWRGDVQLSSHHVHKVCNVSNKQTKMSARLVPICMRPSF